MSSSARRRRTSRATEDLPSRRGAANSTERPPVSSRSISPITPARPTRSSPGTTSVGHRLKTSTPAPLPPSTLWIITDWVVSYDELRCRAVGFLQCLFERGPGEERALDAHWELLDAFQGFQITQLLGVHGLAAHHVLENIDQLVDIVQRLRLHGFGHHRGRGLADGAAAALEGEILELAIVKPHVQLDLIAAQRVIAFHAGGMGIELTAIAGLLVMVEDDLAVQLVEGQAHATLTLASPRGRGNRHPEQLAGFAQALHQQVDLVLGVVQVEAGAGRSGHAQLAHQRMAAVVAGADADALAIQDLGQVVGVHVAVTEGDSAATDLDVTRAVDLDLGHLAQGAERVGGELLLVLTDGLHADAPQVVDGYTQADHVGHVGRASLEFPGQLVPGGVIQPDLADHVAAAHERWHGFQELDLAVQEAAAGGSQHLVAGGGQEVAVQVLHVHRHVRHALGAVQQDDGAGGMRQPGQLFNGVDGAEHVGHVADGHQLGAIGDEPPALFHIQGAVVQHGDVLENGALLGGQQLPGDQVGVVLQLGQDVLVALPDVGPAPAVGHQVDGLRGVADEDDALATGGANERLDLIAGLFVLLGRFLGNGVDAAMDVSVVGAVVVVQRIDDRQRLLRGSGAVEVDQRLAVYLPLEDGEVGANLSDVHAFGSVETSTESP